jgi:hypothetical protein
MENNPKEISKSNGKRNSGWVPLRRGLLEHLHSDRLTVQGQALFVNLVLRAHHAGKYRGCVSGNIEDLSLWTGVPRTTIKRAKDELERKGYVVFERATNQHEQGRFRIPKYDLAGKSAQSTLGPTNPSARSTARPAGGPSSGPSTPSSDLNSKDLRVPKNVKKLRTSNHQEGVMAASSIQKRKIKKSVLGFCRGNAVEVESKPPAAQTRQSLPGYEEARKTFRAITEKSLGSIGGRRQDWLSLIEKYGVSSVLHAVKLFANDVCPRIERVRYPLHLFLADADGWVAETTVKRTEPGQMRELIAPD